MPSLPPLEAVACHIHFGRSRLPYHRVLQGDIECGGFTADTVFVGIPARREAAKAILGLGDTDTATIPVLSASDPSGWR